MKKELAAIAGQVEVGRVAYESGRLSFEYARQWQQDPSSYPLSLSMPLLQDRHGHAPVEAFLRGLLPDNPDILQKWAAGFHVSPANPFALLAYVGEECAGAVQFVRPERLERLRREPEKVEIQWLTEAEIGERLKILRQDHSAWRIAHDTGQFSLAGAQPKTALLFRDGRWGVPSGRTPTTHILKPPLGEWEGHAENEHFCLELAAQLGLAAARTDVTRFGEEIAIVIERYDRAFVDGRILRLHQEDLCQALSILPRRKYESEGGPGVRHIAELLREHSARPQNDVPAFLDAVAFNWFIGGTDAHAKNYSILIGSQGAVRFAPLYDVASILPYPKIYIPKLKMAMKIGGEYRLRQIGLRQWRKLATEVRFDEDRLIERLRAMAAELPDQISAVRRQVVGRELNHPILKRLADVVTQRAKQCAEILD